MLKIKVYPKVSADTTFTITLDEVLIKLRLIWNTKSQYWMVNTYEEPNNGIVLNGLKILPNYPFLSSYNTSLPGQLICMKIGRDTEDYITYNNFGDGWSLFYLNEDEFEAWSDLNGF